MQHLLIALAFMLWLPVPEGEIVERLANETAESFAVRNGPAGAKLAHPVIETEAWEGKAVIAFHETRFEEGGQSYGEAVGYIYTSQSGNRYRRLLIDTIRQEGGDPTIESVFFANADRDRARELIVVASWPVNHYDVHGTLYGTYVFDNPRPNSAQTGLVFLEGISRKLDGGCDCGWRDGTEKKVRYKTAAAIRARLKQLGF